MRLVLAAACAFAPLTLAIAAPAAAQSREPGADIVDSLPHPYDVEAAGDRIGAAVGAIVNIPIGEAVRAIDPAAPVRRDSTIADVAGRGDPNFQGRLQDEVATMSVKAADMVRQIAVVAPTLQRTLVDLQRSLDQALGGLAR